MVLCNRRATKPVVSRTSLATGARWFASLGLDLGSVTLKAVVLDDQGQQLWGEVRRTRAAPLEATRQLLAQLEQQLGPLRLGAGLICGSGKQLLAEHLELGVKNEIVAHAEAAWTAFPGVRSIIEIGGQDSKLIRVERSGDGPHEIADQTFNELCAAGTGAFLDQQARRLGLSTEQLGQLAFAAPRAAPMAGRCSVFAKSDMIHLQQRGCPTEEIAAGLCLALARNYLASLCRGRPPEPLVLFQGGVAANEGVRRAFAQLLELGPEELIRPPGYQLMGAMGAALLARRQPLEREVTLAQLRRRMEGAASRPAGSGRLLPLGGGGEIQNTEHGLQNGERGMEGASAAGEIQNTEHGTQNREPGMGDTAAGEIQNTGHGIQHGERGMEGAAAAGDDVLFLGVDVGSVTTKVVAVDRQLRLCGPGAYLRTAGDPVGAVTRAVQQVLEALPDDHVVAAVVTTGSGRHLARELLSAHEAMDEISAQARSAAHFAPHCDTVIEIGGQDAKYIRLEQGRVSRFEMNRACAAGTGSFLEEQAGRLGVRVEQQFAELALQAEAPVALGSRCTVFMDSDLVHHLQRGARTADLCAGLAYSVGKNYLEKVVGSRPMGRRVLLQGGVARNAAVVAVFGQLLEGKEAGQINFVHTEGAEAPRWPGVRRAHTGGTQPTSNAARADGSAPECKYYFDQPQKRPPRNKSICEAVDAPAWQGAKMANT